VQDTDLDRGGIRGMRFGDGKLASEGEGAGHRAEFQKTATFHLFPLWRWTLLCERGLEQLLFGLAWGICKGYANVVYAVPAGLCGRVLVH
jgi:hypothetical protein